MIGFLRNFLKYIFIYISFRKKNKHNKVIPKNVFDIDIVDIGVGTYGPLRVISFGQIDEKLTIGSYCSIAKDVEFILGGNHNYLRFSTYPFGVFGKKSNASNFESSTKGPIIIGDDVWLAYGSKILSGVTIGRGAIISAFSLVTKNVPPYAIVGGVPARILKYRFSSEMIDELEKLPSMDKLNLNDLLSDYDSIKELKSTDDIKELQKFFPKI